MPDLPLFHANERVDRVDMSAVIAFPRDLDNLLTKYRFLDRQSRIMRGFRVELPDQNQFPGRIVIHGGFGHQYDGQHLFNEDQLNVSRTVTLEGANTTFYVEIEFVESESDVDARAFWDSTVEQGYDTSGDELPDGQEFSANVATRKTPDWQIVLPISTSGFARDQVASLNSNRVPLLKLRTDSANKITASVNTNLATEKAASTMMRYISATQIVVKEPWLFQVGDSIDVTDDAGTDASSVTTRDLETGMMTIASVPAKTPGAIVRVTSSSSPDFITASLVGRYRKVTEDIGVPDHVIDWRDMMWQGDEVHGDILARGHSTVSTRADVNLHTLKDYVDFLAGQIQEMKWGVPDPYASGTDDERVPPGLTSALPTTPRYFDRSGGISGARTAAVTVGDGVSSFGDINGNTDTAIQKALDALPAIGGRIFVKRGTYSFTADVDWTNTGDVVLDGESGTIFELNGGSLHIATTGYVTIRGITLKGGTSNIALLVDTSNPSDFVLTDVSLTDSSFSLNAGLPTTAAFLRTYFVSTSANMSTIPLINITGTSGTLSGTFSQCNFFHTTAVGLAASLIDLVTNSPTVSCSLLNFVDCEFSSWLLNVADVHLGLTASLVSFDRCLFTDIFTLVHVQVGGGSNIKFVNCAGGDALAALVQAVAVSYITVDGYINPNSVPQAAAYFVNCDNVSVRNCDVKVNWGTSLAVGAFKYSTITIGVFKNLTFTNNMIRGTGTAGFNKTVGLFLDLASGVQSMLDGVKVIGNTFDTCEVGAYFANSGAAGFFRNVVISNNEFYDYNALSPNADTAKIGVLFGSMSTKWNVTISNNVFSDFDPGTSDLIGGLSRAAIAITGGYNTRFSINGNTMYKIGIATGGFELPDTAGILINAMADSTIIGNTINEVNGKGAFGIKADSLSRVVVSDNSITDINTLTGGTGVNQSAFGIYSGSVVDSAIKGNTFENIISANAVPSAAIGSLDSASGVWQDVAVVGNAFNSTWGLASLVYVYTQGIRRSSFNSNTQQGTASRCIDLVAGTGGTVESVSIVGNCANGMSFGGIRCSFSAAAATANVSINGNSMYCANVCVSIDSLNFFSVVGNSLTTTSVGPAVSVEDSTRFVVSSNVTARPPGVTANVLIGANCNFYNIHGNVCDDQSGGSGASIDTTGAAQTGDAAVKDNVVDEPQASGTDVVVAGVVQY